MNKLSLCGVNSTKLTISETSLNEKTTFVSQPSVIPKYNRCSRKMASLLSLCIMHVINVNTSNTKQKIHS